MSYVPISVVLKLSCVGSVQRATDPVVIWRQAKHDNKEADEIMAHMMRRSSTMSTVLTIFGFSVDAKEMTERVRSVFDQFLEMICRD
ncbi:hypothetical protein TNIN_279371 [Trichonephila inaurata madagascariensis]|uniref:Uncharacterized protein n=1 Tax=Trichonephila inaurata madagascariensis TaxID=2747483 RepID=A0A8X7CL65_9ARAC|nr:hypothetical protein TNIN_279371 [Trichonephila inaurata madagascariensis]